MGERPVATYCTCQNGGNDLESDVLEFNVGRGWLVEEMSNKGSD